MKKYLNALLAILLISASGFSQNSIVGKWKLVAVYDVESGMHPLADSAGFCENFKKDVLERAKEEGYAATSADSAHIDDEARMAYQEMSSMVFQFFANKTYKVNMSGKQRTGTYVYNAKTQTLTKRSKGKAPEVSKATFEEGQLVIEVKEDNISLYFERSK